MNDPKRHTHNILLAAVRAMLSEDGFDVRSRTRSEPRALNLIVMPNKEFPKGFSVIVRTQNVSGSTEHKAKGLLDSLNNGDLGDRPVMFVVDGKHSDGMKEVLQGGKLSRCVGVFSVRDLLLWLLRSGKQQPRQAVMF